MLKTISSLFHNRYGSLYNLRTRLNIKKEIIITKTRLMKFHAKANFQHKLVWSNLNYSQLTKQASNFMGYTIYWARNKEIEKGTFSQIVNDFKTLLPVFKMFGVKLDIETIDDEEVNFNGIINCGHPKYCKVQLSNIMVPRECSGNCSHEQFIFKRAIQDEYPGILQSFTKTAFKPYDVAVTAFLVIAKHYLQNNLIVDSDGKAGVAFIETNEKMEEEIEQCLEEYREYSYGWLDAIRICESVLGYGKEFKLDSINLLNQLFRKEQVWRILRKRSGINTVSWHNLLKSALMYGVESEKELKSICSEYERAGFIAREENGALFLLDENG